MRLRLWNILAMYYGSSGGAKLDLENGGNTGVEEGETGSTVKVRINRSDRVVK